MEIFRYLDYVFTTKLAKLLRFFLENIKHEQLVEFHSVARLFYVFYKLSTPLLLGIIKTCKELTLVFSNTILTFRITLIQSYNLKRRNTFTKDIVKIELLIYQPRGIYKKPSLITVL